MIYDTFLFDGEWEMLKLRQETLKGKVDAHVALMGIRSFRGNSKAVFTPVLAPDLKTTFELCALPSFSDPWISEHWQRNFALHKLWGLAPNDIVLIGDVDEIPDPENVTHIGAHSMEFFMYNQNWSKKQKWIGTVGVTGQHILEGNLPSMVRASRFERPVIEGGWHLSYFFMDPIRIREKIRSFSHSEYDKPEFTDLESIQVRMDQGLDLFDRGESQDCLFVQSGYLPPAFRAS